MKIEISNAHNFLSPVDMEEYPQLKDVVQVDEAAGRSYTTKFQSIGEAVEWLTANVYEELIVDTGSETPRIIIYDYYVE